MTILPLRQLTSSIVRSISRKSSPRVLFRTNATVTTPQQVTSPAIIAPPPPPASSYIRGTRKPIGGFRGGYSNSLLFNTFILTLALLDFFLGLQSQLHMDITTSLRHYPHNQRF